MPRRKTGKPTFRQSADRARLRAKIDKRRHVAGRQ
jgi:hypothetical protein